jgi:3-methyladenine DNA glycosylase AlkD
MVMHPYSKSLQKLYQQHADPEKAAPMKAYMRNQFDYLGIKSPEASELSKSFIAKNGLPELAELEEILRELWSLPEREYQYFAVGLLGRMEKQLPPNFVGVMEYLLVTKSWWDTVDSLAGGTIGIHFKRYPRVKEKYVARWRKSENFWLRRTTLLFQLGYKNETDFPLLCDLIRENLGSKEFFINKAIGWSLRQYSRIDPDGVRTFVAQTPLHPLSKREALKWLENRKSKI